MPIAAQLARFGSATEAVRLVEQTDPDDPGPAEILVRMQLAPINQADLLMITGGYGFRSDLPCALGAEGVGIVVQAGTASGFAKGDQVIPLVRGCWAQILRLPADAVLRVPPGLSLAQAATLRINPATARRLLNLVALKSGDWIMQNGAGGSLGRLVAAFSARAGLNCLSVVRRRNNLMPIPGEIIIEDSTILSDDIKPLTKGAPIRLALDCVAGEASGRMASCLEPGGTLVVFGHLSGAPCSIPSTLLTSRGLTVRGFSLRPTESGATQGHLNDFYHHLAADIGDLHPNIAATYKLRDLHAALDHAARPGRGGKIMLDFT